MNEFNNMKTVELLEAIREANENIGLYMNCGQIKTANDHHNKIGLMVEEVIFRLSQL